MEIVCAWEYKFTPHPMLHTGSRMHIQYTVVMHRIAALVGKWFPPLLDVTLVFHERKNRLAPHLRVGVSQEVLPFPLGL